MSKMEMPFVVGVLADLSGHRDPHGEPPSELIGERRFVGIDADNFDDVMSRIQPRLALRVLDELRKDGTEVAVELHFRGMADFEPAAIIRQIEPLRRLLEARQQPAGLQAADGGGNRPVEDITCRGLADPDGTGPMRDDRTAEIDRLLGDQLNAILHHPDFQKLEASWRGLHYLVSASETGEILQIRVLDVSKDELLRDMERAAEFDRSGLFEAVYAAEYEVLGGTPYSVLIGDFEFGAGPREIELLGRIARVAAAAHAPFIAGASPRLFHLESFAELSEPRELARIFEGVEYAAWNAFRASGESRYVALCLPHILMREPHGGHTRSVEEFRFEEDLDGPDDSKYLWGNAAYALGARITEAFAMYGWCARISGVETGGLVGDLLLRSAPTDEGEVASDSPAEVAISERREFELARLGFIALAACGRAGHAAFLSAPSCHKPARYQDPDATAAAERSAQLPDILTTSRFAHYLKVMARDMIGSFEDTGDCAAWLNGWIQNYVVINPEVVDDAVRARCPLVDARVDIEAMAGKPGWYEVVCYLCPHHQFATPAISMRLMAEIPRRR
jgi:type VI secretion system protein ImpC